MSIEQCSVAHARLHALSTSTDVTDGTNEESGYFGDISYVSNARKIGKDSASLAATEANRCAVAA